MSERVEPTLWSGPSTNEPVTSIVLVLHGGKVASHARSRPWHLSAVRMWQFTRALRRTGRSRGVLVAQLQYRYRGWNGVERSPVRDARWALHRLHRQYPGVHVVVVGHSMGGRTAAAVADDPWVSGVVALAPWWPDGGELQSVGQNVVVRVAHGVADTWTDAVKSRREVASARARGIDATFAEMPGGHFMIRRARQWVAMTVSSVVDIVERATSEGNGVVS